ncbi:MAG: helix-turn-helix domain-containing protein [Paracoccaceae bacterium]|uniref:helix-turn-helix domain-containing protein n=1 Tax=Celeribacter marinus TaxID=1397108 RepID=UPI0031762D22
MLNAHYIAWLNRVPRGRYLVMNLQERVGQNIQDARRAKGLSQEALSFAAGLSRSYMGKLENGRNAMSISALESIALALGVDPSELVKPRART